MDTDMYADIGAETCRYERQLSDDPPISAQAPEVADTVGAIRLRGNGSNDIISRFQAEADLRCVYYAVIGDFKIEGEFLSLYGKITAWLDANRQIRY